MCRTEAGMGGEQIVTSQTCADHGMIVLYRISNLDPSAAGILSFHSPLRNRPSTTTDRDTSVSSPLIVGPSRITLRLLIIGLINPPV
jgi:hypothetical protein